MGCDLGGVGWIRLPCLKDVFLLSVFEARREGGCLVRK